jgi:hypothetical protein
MGLLWSGQPNLHGFTFHRRESMKRYGSRCTCILLLALMAATILVGCGGGAASSPVTDEPGSTAGGGTASPTETDEPGPPEDSVDILFLHHSTGEVIWGGGVSDWFDNYNATHGTIYQIEERAYPDEPYPWANYPYDYWNLWVKHAGDRPYEKQDTLEMLTQAYDVIVWKHCFPVSDVEANTGAPDVSSEVKTIENYQVQYEALKEKMHQFPDTLFLVWTGAAQVAGATDEAYAQRAKQFFDWVEKSWDEPGDNIYLWDFRQLETEGGLYLLDRYAASSTDSHPNDAFAARVAPLFAQRIVDVIEGRGDSGSLTGE